MKKRIAVVTAVLALTVVSVTFAQMETGKEMMEEKGMEMMKEDSMSQEGMMVQGRMSKGMMDQGTMGKGMMGKGMMDGKIMERCSMMKSMMERSVVATSDGGVVIVMGNKLTKYDTYLNVVKEVELKTDMEGMQKMMENMKGMCPMMGKGMMKKMDNAPETKADSTVPEVPVVPEAPVATAEEVDHESHH